MLFYKTFGPLWGTRFMHIPHTAATPLGRCSINGFLAGVALAFGDLGPPIALLRVAWNAWCPIVELGRPHRCGVGKSASREGNCQHGHSIDRSGEQ